MDDLTRRRLIELGLALPLPGEARNRGDRIFDEALLTRVKGSRARFDFVV